MSGPPGAPPRYHVTLTRRRARQLVAGPGWGRQSEYRSRRDCVCVCAVGRSWAVTVPWHGGSGGIRTHASEETGGVGSNRSDRVITVHRRSVIGFIERVEHVDTRTPDDTDSFEVNAVSADDGRFLGSSADDVLGEFVIGEPLSAGQRDKLASLLRSFPEVFSRGYADIGLYKGGDVDLELQPGARPTFVKPYPVPWAREEQLQAQLDDLRACGIIENGAPSDWNSPILLVPKGKKGVCDSREFRIVQDMRSLNKNLVPKTFVFPNIDEFIYSLGGWKVASSLDIKHAFWNLRLTKASSNICAFYALGKTWYPCRMPMGCMQSSYFLHLAMHKVLGDIPGVHIYADDVLLTSASVDEHLSLLHTVLEKLRSAGLKVAPDKCRLFQTKLTYLGHLITPGGIGIDPERIKAVADMPPPRTVKEAKRVFGFFSWFRKFIPSLSLISEPLVLLCNSEKFYWNEVLQHCFESLRSALMSDEVLSYPRRDGHFVLYTDSSTTGSGQVLCQVQDGQERVIAFNGNRYSKAQRRWTIFELELFSFIQGLKKFYKYLADAEFKWVCDCKSALSALSNRDNINPRLMRWRSFVSQFRFEPEHRRAPLMAHVDALSRMYEPGNTDIVVPRDRVSPKTAEGHGNRVLREPAHAAVGDTIEPAATPGPGSGPRGVTPRETAAEGVQAGVVGGPASKTARSGEVREINFTADTLAGNSLKPDALKWYQRHDRNCRAIAHRLNHGKWPRFAPPALKREPAAEFSLRGGLVYRGERLVWPLAKRYELMYEHHDVSHHAHGGAGKLYEILKRHAWYPGLRTDCDDYVRSCQRCCQKKSTDARRPPLLPQPSAYPNQVLIIDILAMPRGHSSKASVLTCIDKFSGYLVYYALNPAFAGGGGVKRPHFFRRVITPVWRGAAAPNFG